MENNEFRCPRCNGEKFTWFEKLAMPQGNLRVIICESCGTKSEIPVEELGRCHYIGVFDGKYHVARLTARKVFEKYIVSEEHGR